MRKIMLVLGCLNLMLTGQLGAAEIFRGGDVVVIEQGEVIKADLRVGASKIVIAGVVQGNVIIGGDSVVISGKVTGNVTCGAKSLKIGGEDRWGCRRQLSGSRR